MSVRNGKIASAYGKYAWGIIWNTTDLSLYYDSMFSQLSGTTGFDFKMFGFHTTSEFEDILKVIHLERL